MQPTIETKTYKAESGSEYIATMLKAIFVICFFAYLGAYIALEVLA
jgi:hypothetical protein